MSDQAWEILSRASTVQLAANTPNGLVLRTLHSVVWDGALYVHGSRRGEKQALAGATVIANTEQIVARIPSWMRDPERACPATTLYRSAQAHGVLEDVSDRAEKASALQAMMLHLQPEGRYRPITPTDPLYVRALDGLQVLRLRPSRLQHRVKLAQDKPLAQRIGILRGLWQRGAPGDLSAIEAIAEANPATPPLHEVPGGLRCVVAPTARDLDQVIGLLDGAYWHADTPTQTIRASHNHSDAWVVLRDGDEVVATARAISDWTRRSWVYDVVVRSDRRGAGLGSVLLRVLLDHPALRETTVWLGTRDAHRFYQRLGFQHAGDSPHGATMMTRYSPSDQPQPVSQKSSPASA